jgi:hypothetical protein
MGVGEEPIGADGDVEFEGRACAGIPQTEFITKGITNKHTISN